MNILNTNFFGISGNYAGSLFSSISQNRNNQRSNFTFAPELYQGFSEVSSKGYKSLLKAYYSQDTEKTKETTDDVLNSLNKDKNAYVSASTLKSQADSLKNTATTLIETEDFTKNREGINDKVKSFANDYNKLLSTAKNSKTNNFNISSLNTQLSVLSKVNQKALGEIGVNVNTDGTLTVDSKKLEAASEESLKKVFGGSSSFGAQVVDKAKYVSENASKYASNNNLYNHQANYYNALNTGSFYNSFF